MEIIVKRNPKELGEAAGKSGAELIRKAIEQNGFAHIILATGTRILSQKNLEIPLVLKDHKN